MSTMEFKIRTNGTEADMKVDGVESAHITQVISGLFAELSKGKYGVLHAEEPVSRIISSEPIKTVEIALESATAPLREFPSPLAHKTNNTAILREIETMEEAVEATAPQQKELPSHFKTGYKLSGTGVKLYKARYKCPKCKNAGNHYIPESVKTVDCHNCQTTMQVKKATPGTQGIQPDRFLNWFVAGEQLPVSQFIYGQAKKVD